METPLSTRGDSAPERRDSVALHLRVAEERLLRLRLASEGNQSKLQAALSELQEDLREESEQREVSLAARHREILQAGRTLQHSVETASQEQRRALMERPARALVRQRGEVLAEQLRRRGEQDAHGRAAAQLRARVDALTKGAADSMEARETAFQEVARSCEARVSKLRSAVGEEVARRRGLASSLREMVETTFYQMNAVAEHAAREEVQKQLMDILEEAVSKLEAAAAAAARPASRAPTPEPAGSTRPHDVGLADAEHRQTPPAGGPLRPPLFSAAVQIRSDFRANDSFGADDAEGSASVDISLAQLPDTGDAASEAGSFAYWARRNSREGAVDTKLATDSSGDRQGNSAAYADDGLVAGRVSQGIKSSGVRFTEEVQAAQPGSLDRHDDSSFSPLVSKLEAATLASPRASERHGEERPSAWRAADEDDWQRWSSYRPPDGGSRSAAVERSPHPEAEEPFHGSPDRDVSSELTARYYGGSSSSAGYRDQPRGTDEWPTPNNAPESFDSTASVAGLSDLDASLSRSGLWDDSLASFQQDEDEESFAGSSARARDSAMTPAVRSINSPTDASSPDGGQALLWSLGHGANGRTPQSTGKPPLGRPAASIYRAPGIRTPL
eukprot:jgi/Tetstr1/450274/TSEL_037310.t1